MGIWVEARLIYGSYIELSLESLNNIKKFDSNFEYTTINDKSNNRKYNVYIGNDDYQEDQKYHDIWDIICDWLQNKYPKLTILHSCPLPSYDCPASKFQYFLSFNLKCSEFETKISLTELTAELATITGYDIETFKQIFQILCPNKPYEAPTIQAQPYI